MELTPATWAFLAQCVLVVHAAFVIFVAVGGLLALRWPRLLWVHAPALVWGVAILIGGWICPLTPLELELRARAGLPPYSGGFLDHYVMPWMYPAGVSRGVQIALAIGVFLVNALVYWRVLARRRGRIGNKR
jgi:hypothetical protein